MIFPLFTPSLFHDESPLGLIQRAATGNHCKNTLQLLRGLRCGTDDASTALPALGHQESLLRDVYRRIGIAEHAAPVYRKIGASREGDLEWKGFRVPMSALSMKEWKFCPHCLANDGYSQAHWDHRAMLACKRHRYLLRSSCAHCGRITTYNNRMDRCTCGAIYAGMETEKVADAEASLAEDVVASGAQAQVDQLDAIYMQVSDWSRCGLRFNNAQKLSSISALFNSEWPKHLIPTSSKASDAIHPRALLARLLNSQHSHIVEAAGTLLQKTSDDLCFQGIVEPDFRIAGDHSRRVLGIARAPFDKIVAAGILKRRGKMYSLARLNELLISLMATSKRDSQGLQITDLRSARYRASLAAILQRIHGGEIQSQGFSPAMGLESLRVDRWTSESPDIHADFYRISDLVRLFNVNEVAIRFLISKQWIHGEFKRSNGIRYLCVSKRDAEAFNQQFCFAVNMPAPAHLSRRERLRYCLSEGHRPVSGPMIDGGPTYLFMGPANQSNRNTV